MKTCKIYIIYDDIAKTVITVEKFNTEEHAVTFIKNLITQTQMKKGKMTYRLCLYSVASFDPLNLKENEFCFKLVKTFKN